MFLLVLLAAAASSPSSLAVAEDDLEGFCDGITAGIFPHPDPVLCYKYVSCVFGESNVYQCAEGFIFDPEIFECKPGSWDDCSRTDPELELICSAVSFGVFEFPENCTKFVFCELGNPNVIECLSNEIWWQEQGVCLFGNRDTCQPGDVFCMGRPDGVIPHPNGCEFYIECIDERSTEFECPRGQIFSFGSLQCVVGSATTCRSLEEVCLQQPPQQTHPHPDFCDLFIRCDGSHASIDKCGDNEIFRPDIRFCVPGDSQTCVASRPEVACQGRPDGIIPHPDGCKLYIRCVGGTSTVESCPIGHILRPDLQLCVAGDSETCQLLDGVCAGRPDRYVIEHPNHCGMFIWCIGGRAEVHNCPPGEILRPDMQFCVPGNVDTCEADSIEEMCDGRQGPVIYPHPYRCDQFIICNEGIVTIHTCQEDTIVQPGTIQCVPGNAESCELYTDLCVGRPDGVIPHPSRCQLFINCAGGHVNIQSCPEGHIFDSTESRCIPGNTETCDNLDDYCLDRPDGVIPHPNRCDLFMLCSAGVTSVHSCPWGEILRPDMQFCAPGNSDTCEFTDIDAMCDGREGPVIYPHPDDCTLLVVCRDSQVTLEPCPEGKVLQPGTMSCVAGNSDTCELYIDRCAAIEQGVLPHPSVCHLFLRCHFGQTTVESCGRGQIFDADGGQCVVGNRDTCENLSGMCGPLSDRVVVHPNHCDLKIECRDGVTSMHACPSGQILHQNMQVCAPGSANDCELHPIDDMCLGQPQAIFPPPDQLQCLDYVVCSNGLATVHSCGIGTVLRPRFLDCVPGDVDTCEYFPHLCLFRPNENIPHPTRCDLFISCVSEVAIIVPCARGETFSPELGLCAPGDASTCESFFEICDGLETAILEHPIHCDLFIVCMSGLPVVFACQIGQILDPEQLVCTPGNADTCELYPMPDPKYSATLGSCSSSAVQSCTRDLSPDAITNDICTRSGTYNVPHPFVCHRYIQCISRTARIRDCPETHVFNAMLNACIIGDRKKCK
ncbi:fibrillin-1-like [Topomyia yanbarensis]|uniref:fibrillin-1-like n=1 Tax=Topomyia yanbarensis TaxID=2498891 RepID=UPI00273A84AD|nr:fibrillin-1-like [Topomyia yanbarensis]